MRRRTTVGLVVAASLSLICGCADPCADFVGDCIGVGIAVNLVDQDGEAVTVESVAYVSDTGASGEACDTADGCAWIWIPVEPEDASYTITVTRGVQEQTQTVVIDSGEVEDVQCCGSTLQEEVTFEFTN
jgi:hypothetical protein